MSKLKNNNSGFSFVEILVAFAIITTSTVAIFSLIIQNIQVQRVNKDLLTASMLAQEGIELTRSIRDENWLQEVGGTGGTAVGVWDELNGDGDFVIDPFSWVDDTVNNVGDSATITDDPNTRLYLDANGFYKHGITVEATPFYRIIEISFGPDSDSDGYDDYADIVSRVEWKSHGAVKHYIAEATLYDWR